ncbi:winged helix-turn-helix domain-containing protein [Streptomyces sp. NPDC005349]|uniref:winged helix-turn-helix domain-containing protein n=1 Tax=Streptomyces sp. NPDC005349 TaxID=3157037 RepID=UPI0033AC1DB6
MDPSARRCLLDDQEVQLRPKEFELLAVLAWHAGAAVSRETLMAQVWDENWFGPTKTLDVTLASLRRAFTKLPQTLTAGPAAAGDHHSARARVPARERYGRAVTKKRPSTRESTPDPVAERAWRHPRTRIGQLGSRSRDLLVTSGPVKVWPTDALRLVHTGSATQYLPGGFNRGPPRAFDIVEGAATPAAHVDKLTGSENHLYRPFEQRCTQCTEHFRSVRGAVRRRRASTPPPPCPTQPAPAADQLKRIADRVRKG